MRLCPNVPAQHAIQVALGGHQSIEDLVLPGGRLLEQRDVAWTKLNEIPGVSCVKPAGRAVRLPAAGPRGLRHRRRRTTRPRPAAAGEDPGHPGHRLQLAHARSPAHRHAALGPRPGQRHRAAGQLPRQLPPVVVSAASRVCGTRGSPSAFHPDFVMYSDGMAQNFAELAQRRRSGRLLGFISTGAG